MLTLQQVMELIKEKNGKIFTIRFKKRTDGELREMTCRQGVKKYLSKNPEREPTDFKANNLIPVYDMVQQGYRCIPIEGILAFKIDGKWQEVRKDSHD